MKEIGRIAKKYDLWFHVDGSLGGTLLLHKKHKDLLAGCDLADSFTRNPHKMMNIPILASLLLVKEK
ncbi:hypothetical protein KBC03_07520 [Patescibacteria group bacterium]|nr:hypothetical protein [Patescibacteria group bacterium]